MSSKTITVARAVNAENVTRISVGRITVEFEGDGPWDLTPDEWRAVQTTAAREWFVADDATDAADAPRKE